MQYHSNAQEIMVTTALQNSKREGDGTITVTLLNGTRMEGVRTLDNGVLATEDGQMAVLAAVVSVIS